MSGRSQREGIKGVGRTVIPLYATPLLERRLTDYPSPGCYYRAQY